MKCRQVILSNCCPPTFHLIFSFLVIPFISFVSVTIKVRTSIDSQRSSYLKAAGPNAIISSFRIENP
jgi:hypothetical protein